MRWERTLLAFFRRELAPSWQRWRFASRLTVVIIVCILLIMALHVPEGEFLLVSLFVTSPGNAGASIQKGVQRLFATLIAGGIAIVVLAASPDKPWLLFPIHAVVVAVAMFLMRASTVPYACLLAAVTFVMVVPTYPAHPAESIDTALWRIALTVLGVVIGTGSQLVLWPDDPEKLLLEDLARRLRDAAAMLTRLRTLPPEARPPLTDEDVATTGVTGQLDLLENAETKTRWLRWRHAEQIELITDVQLLGTAARRLARILTGHPVPAWVLPRLEALADGCACIATALHEHRPLTADDVRPLESRTQPPEASAPLPAPDEFGLETRAAIEEMERALRQMPGALGFLALPAGSLPGAVRAPIADIPIFTADCNLGNVDAIHFATKVAISTSICALIIEATDWPGLSTAIISSVLVAQSFFGAGLRKGMLRIAGASIGALMAFLVIVAAMPNMQTLAALLVVLTPCFGAAAWILAGSARTNYIGLQVGIILALTLVNLGAPTTNLVPAADRVLGILLGIGVMAIVDVTFWPVFGPVALRRKLGDVLRRMAALHRRAATGDRAGMRQDALGVYRALGEALAMHDDIRIEPNVLDTEHQALVRLTNSVGRVFLHLLAVARHRTPSEAADDSIHRLDDAIVAALETLGRRIQPSLEPPPPRAPFVWPSVEPGGSVTRQEVVHLSHQLVNAIETLAQDFDTVRQIRVNRKGLPSPSNLRPQTPAPLPS